MQKFRPSVRPPAFSWPLTVRGRGSRWSHCQRINNDLIRKAGGSSPQSKPSNFNNIMRESAWAVHSTAGNAGGAGMAAKPPAGLPDLYCVLK
jgi:hypothetical protein